MSSFHSVGVGGDEVGHHRDALGVVEHDHLDAARAQVVLAAVERAVLADHDTAGCLYSRIAPVHMSHGDSVVTIVDRAYTVAGSRPAFSRQSVSPCRMALPSCTRRLCPTAQHLAVDDQRGADRDPALGESGAGLGDGEREHLVIVHRGIMLCTVRPRAVGLQVRRRGTRTPAAAQPPGRRSPPGTAARAAARGAPRRSSGVIASCSCSASATANSSAPSTAGHTRHRPKITSAMHTQPRPLTMSRVKLPSTDEGEERPADRHQRAADHQRRRSGSRPPRCRRRRRPRVLADGAQRQAGPGRAAAPTTAPARARRKPT